MFLLVCQILVHPVAGSPQYPRLPVASVSYCVKPGTEFRYEMNISHASIPREFVCNTRLLYIFIILRITMTIQDVSKIADTDSTSSFLYEHSDENVYW